MGAGLRLALTRLIATMLVAALAGACGEAPPDSGGTQPAIEGGTAVLETPPPAREVVADAVRAAAAENKAVLIEFGASWCTWCTNFQNFVQSNDAGRVMRDNFVVVTLVVREAEGKEVLEHPGGAELMTEWGGAESGLPFYVFLDAEGRKVADSNAMPDGGNIGYPVTKVEIERFMSLLDTAAPRLTSAARATVLGYLQKAAEQLGVRS
jgi:thiol:disulfide interchange protein